MQSDHISLPAPAKLNLFLHITARRADGYHELQTVFQFLDHSDVLHFALRDDDAIVLTDPVDGVASEADLTYRAAKLLQARLLAPRGVTISMDKRLPIGGGLGGGSSDAATTLVALNRLWNLSLEKQDLLDLALLLGADVPVFVHGHACWAEGVGEQLAAIDLPEPWYLVICPTQRVSTAAVFGASELTRNCSPITIRDFLAGSGGNIFEPVVRKRVLQVDTALDWLSDRFAQRQAAGASFAGCRHPSMSGTGSCVFLSCETQKEALNLLVELPAEFAGFVAKGCNVSPLQQTLASAAGSM